MGNPNLKEQVQALQLSVEGLFRLLVTDKERFLEIVLGITSVQAYELLSQDLVAMTHLVKQVESGAHGIINVSKLGESGKTASAD